MKSVKVFFFFSILPCVVPGFAHVAAAADVRDGVDDAAVEQAQPRRARNSTGIEAP